MAHTSLYRKYRPATFDDVVGQQHIEQTIRNAIGDGAVAHAYLFTGPRGTGKTTTARLLAKALLCERGPTGEPDATCEQCVQISEGRHPDVYELDAASRTGVENVREEIIGRVTFAPTFGRSKIYIIDEVHMLSTAAFNALLKTLEEPPPGVVFVMCTTHPNKVPETIQSRCQRFDFRRLSVEDIADRLRFIAEAEGMNVDLSAFALIARHARGGMRDAITALEQLAAFTGGEITADDVEGLLGEVDSAQLFEAATLIARRDVAGAFRWVASLVETGTDLTQFVRELTGHVRDLYVTAAVGDAKGIVSRSESDIARLAVQAPEFGGPDRIARVLDLLGELGAEMRWSSDPRLSLEVALTRMARPQGEMTLEALAERVEALELGAPAVGPPATAVSPSAQAPVADAAAAPAQRSRRASAEKPAREAPSAQAPKAPDAIAPPEEPAQARPSSSDRSREAKEEPVTTGPVRRSGRLDRAAVKRDWQAVLMEVKKARPARVQTYASVEVDVDADGETVVLEFPADQSFSMQLAEEPEMRDLLKRAFAAVFGGAPPFRFQLGRGRVRPETDVQDVASERPRVDVDPEDPPSHDDSPVPEYYETASGSTEPTRGLKGSGSAGANAAPAPATDLEELLVHGLGAEIVGEHVHTPEDEES